MHICRRIAVALAFLVAPSWATSAAAQSTPPAATPEDASADIVVTAQRREQRLQDVPISITAIGGEQVTRLGIANAGELISQAPNVAFQLPTGSLGFPIFNIRGVTLLDFSDSNESSVAVYADDVYLGSPALQNQTLFDVERVEILRGPQGTLYGRNATGGLVNFISRKPTEQLNGYADVRYGADNEYTLEGALSGPLADSLRARVAGRFSARDGWQTNLFNGRKLGGIDGNLSLRGIIEADPTDRLKLTVNGHYGRISGQEDGRAFYGARVPGSIPSTRCTTQAILSSQCVNASGFNDPNPTPTRVYSEEDSLPARIESYGGWLRADWKLGFAQLTSITSFDDATKLDTLDADESPSPAGRLTLVYNTTHRQFSQELRLNGTSRLIDWIVGGYYYDDRRFFTATLIRLGGNGSYADQTVATAAGFAQITLKATDTLNLTGGARFTHDERNLEALARIATGGVPGTRLGTTTYIIPRVLEANRVTWRAAVDWHFAPGQLVYASVSTGFKSGAFNTLLPAANPNTVVPAGPESTTAYEIGLKGSLGRLTYGLAAFYTDYRDIQAQGTLANPTPVSSLDSIGNARIFGLEADISARPVRGLTMTLGVGLLDTRIKSPGFLLNGTPIDGNRLVAAPPFNVNGTIRYETEIGSLGKVYGSTDFRVQGRVFFGPDNLATETQGGYGIINFGAGWILPSSKTEIGLFVKNATDRAYFVHGVDSGGATQVGFQWGRERTWGLRAHQSF